MRGADVDHHERDDERRRDHPGRAPHAVLNRQRAAAAARSPSMSAKSFVVVAPRRNRPKIAADVPRLDAEDGLHRRPAGHLQQHAARDRDRDVRPDAEPLRPERRHRVEVGADDGDGDEPEAFVPSAGRDEPGEHQRQGVGDVGEPPDLRDRQPPARQRPLRFVHAIDLEVVDLVQRVVAGVEQRRHRRADERRRSAAPAPTARAARRRPRSARRK